MKYLIAPLIFFLFQACALRDSSRAGNSIDLPEISCSLNLTEGYTDKVSYDPGEIMKVYLHASNPLELCRLNVKTINGDSVFSVAATLPFHYPYPWTKGSIQGFDYKICAEVLIPPIKSGVYLIENLIPFIVKSTTPVDVTIIYPSNTANAYCESGGLSLYSSTDRPYQVSFQRPTPLQSYSRYCLEWFAELDGISFGYIADVDLDDYSNIQTSKIISVIGHSEYWTYEARKNFDRFVDEGGHALVLSGNTMWWQVRYSEDKTKLIAYKEYADKDTVADAQRVTTTWNSPSLNYPIIPSIGVDFQHGGYGLQSDQGWDGLKVALPESPLFEGAGLKKGDIIDLPSLECDGVPLQGYDRDGFPVPDKKALPFENLELLAFDKVFRFEENTTTFIAFQRKPSSGIIINTGTTGWCSETGIGGSSGAVIKKITLNAINKMLKGQAIFISDR